MLGTKNAEIEEKTVEITTSNEMVESIEAMNCEIHQKSIRTWLVVLIALMIAIIIAISGFIVAFTLKKKDAVVEEITEIPSTLLFMSTTEETNKGILYYKLLDGEKEKVAEDVDRYNYGILPKTQLVYYIDSNGSFYCKYPGDETIKVAENVEFSSLKFSEDEQTILFSVLKDQSRDLYIKNIHSDKEKIASDVAYYPFPQISDDGKTIYYVDEDDNFYVWFEESEEKIGSKVSFFSAEKHSYLYSTIPSEGTDINTYVKVKDDVEPTKIDSSVENVTHAKNEMSIYYLRDISYAEESDDYYGDLYLYANTIGEKRVASDVKKYELAGNGSYIYYTNTDGDLYVKKLPEITEKTSKNPEKYKEAFEKSEKIRIGTDIDVFYVSNDGESIACIDEDENLYISMIGKEKVKVGTDVKSAQISDGNFVFVTNDGNLYVNNDYKDSKDIKGGNSVIAEEIDIAVMSEYGQYIAYCNKKQEKVHVFSKNHQISEVARDAAEYDEIKFKGTVLYENLLTMSDFVGKYYIEEENCLLEIAVDGEFSYYLIGEPCEGFMKIYHSQDKYNSYVEFRLYAESDSTYCRFEIDKERNKKIHRGDTVYVLNTLSTDDFEAKISEQKEAERMRLEEEKRKAELAEQIKTMENLGKRYYREGKYISNTETLYDAPSYSSAIDDKFTTSATRDVYDYSVAEDGKTLWLKVRATRSEGYTSFYVWVPVSA